MIVIMIVIMVVGMRAAHVQMSVRRRVEIPSECLEPVLRRARPRQLPTLALGRAGVLRHRGRGLLAMPLVQGSVKDARIKPAVKIGIRLEVEMARKQLPAVAQRDFHQAFLRAIAFPADPPPLDRGGQTEATDEQQGEDEFGRRHCRKFQIMFCGATRSFSV